VVEATGVELFHILCFSQVADSTNGIKGIKGQSGRSIVRVSYTGSQTDLTFEADCRANAWVLPKLSSLRPSNNTTDADDCGEPIVGTSRRLVT
jgi:hypothetical protein